MDVINKLLRNIFFIVIVRFIVLIMIGLNVRHREKLPTQGPAIIVANHNSHLDTLVLMQLLPYRLLTTTHPVAAADYFLKNKFLSWFSQKIIGIIPILRTKNVHNDPLLKCHDALDKNEILILFPEGTRGEPEHLASFKKGISFLASKYREIPIIPVYMQGLGKALPKGDFVFVPFFCDVFIGDPIYGLENKELFMKSLQDSFDNLIKEAPHNSWD